MSASEKLKALDAAATPGPWGVYEDVEMSGGEPYPFHRLTNDKGWLMSLDASDLRKPDAHLMAALRSALPQIVAVVEAAERTDDGPNLTGGSHRICLLCRYDLNFAESSTTRADGHGENCPLAALEEALS